MATIQAGRNILTLINVFTVSPEKQEELLNYLISNTDEFISKCPGFISANFHRSLDGKNVVNYGQWESMEAFQGMLQSEAGRKMIADGNKIADAIQPNLYFVHDTREA